MKKVVQILDSCGYCWFSLWDIFSGLLQRDGPNENSEGPWVSK